MGLDGGGGGGGILGVGNSYTGTSLQLDLVGDHLYAYSGVVGVTDVETPMIETKTGNYYAVVEIQFCGNFQTGHNYEAKVYLNDGVVMDFLMSATEDAPPLGYFPFNLIIPGYTNFKITLANLTATTANNWDVQVTGRIYR